MKKQFLFLIAGISFFANAMDTGDSDAQEALEWLTRSTRHMAPEVAVQVTNGWQRGMSFLKRYMQRNFNVADIYADVVFFNECEFSHATYRMTYSQIKLFLASVSELQIPSSLQSSEPLCQKYIQLIGQWKEFDAYNQNYRQAWDEGKWEHIRKEMASKKN